MRGVSRHALPLILASLTLSAQVSAALAAPDEHLQMLKNQPLQADSIFSGDKFPGIDFMNRPLVIAAVGPYNLHIRFFDADWNEVTEPKKPGRYGAKVEFQSADGLTFSQNLTLFKTTHPYVWAKESYDPSVKLPSAFGIPDEVATREAWSIGNTVDFTLGKAEGVEDWTASLLAGLQDLANDPARWHGFDVWSINNAWWSELGRRLGEKQDYAHLTYQPNGYDKDERAWPLILFLHGSGERGQNLNTVKDQGPLGYIHKGHPLPFLVVTPQCPDDEAWEPVRLARLLDTVAKSYRVDRKRVYVTGLSLGGFGSFDFAATYPDRVAAIAPLSGGETPALAERLKQTPAWIFHGAEDPVVPARLSSDLADAMKKVGAPVKLTIYPHTGHGGWDVTYSNPALYSWFLDHTK